MSATPWTIGSTEYAQERHSGFLRWRDCGVPSQANRRSQAILERCRAMAEADASHQGEWRRLRVQTVRPDGCPVTGHVRCSTQEAASWRKSPRGMSLPAYQHCRTLASLTPVAPLPPVKGKQYLGDSVDLREAWQLAAWRRRYLCDVKPTLA